MLTAILILTIFNTGLIIIIGAGTFGLLKELIIKSQESIKEHIDHRTETAVTAVFNMDSLKQKAEISGKVEM